MGDFIRGPNKYFFHHGDELCLCSSEVYFLAGCLSGYTHAIKLDHIIIIIKMDNAVLEILSNNALPTACETSYEALFGASFPT